MTGTAIMFVGILIASALWAVSSSLDRVAEAVRERASRESSPVEPSMKVPRG